MALAMKEGSSGAGRPRSIVREGLIVVQVALSVLLLGAGGLLVRSFFMLHRGPGFDPDRVAIVRLRPSLVGFTNDRAWAYQREVIERLEALPGVLAASPASVPPLPGGPDRSRRRGFPGTRPIRRRRIRWARRSSVRATSRRWASASSRVANSMTATRWTVRASPS